MTRFLGGLNKALPPHVIDAEDIIDATNFYYKPENGFLTTREGIKRNSTAAAPGSVVGVYSFVYAGTEKKLIVTDETPQKLYYMNGLEEPIYIMDLSGSERPSFATINDICYIATGGVLDWYDGTNTGQTTSPSMNFITDHAKASAARIIGCGNSTLRDRLFLSGVNDGQMWTFDSTDESKAQYIDAGYKDGLDLVGVGTYYGDAFLFKKGPSASTKGIYRASISNALAQWACPRFKQFNTVLSPHMLKEVSDGLLFIDREGPKLLQNIVSNADIHYDITPAMMKIAGEMARYVSTDGFIIIDPLKMLAMVKPSKNSGVFYVMDIVNKRWTYFKYGVNIQSGAFCGGKMLFGATDGYLYEYDETLSQDNGIAYAMTAESKWFDSALYDQLMKEKYLDILGLSQADGAGVMILKVKGAAKHNKPFTFTAGWWDWATVNAIDPSAWTEELTKTPISTVSSNHVVGGDYISVAVSITSGLCSLSQFGARVAITGRK